jgi:uncharacterized membrane protein
LILALSLHVLAAVFWAGSTFTLARTGGVAGEKLFRPQMGAAVIVVLTGGYLWHLLHEGRFESAEQVLTFAAICALIAAGVQGALGGPAIRKLRTGQLSEPLARARIAVAQRIAAGLLAVTAIGMVAAKYV